MHTSTHPLSSTQLLRHALLGTLVALAATSAGAGPVTAIAARNLVGSSIDTNDGSSASAIFSTARADTTRTSVSVSALGDPLVGNTSGVHLSGAGSNRSGFTFVDADGNTLGEAAVRLLDLSFNFKLIGQLQASGSITSAGANMTASVLTGSTEIRSHSGVSVGCGPSGCVTSVETGSAFDLFNGGAAYAHDFVIGFDGDDLLGGQNGGTLLMSLNGLAFREASFNGLLTLESVSYVEGVIASSTAADFAVGRDSLALASGLSARDLFLRLETGELLRIGGAVTDVPEPPALALVLAGLLGMRLLPRQRRGAATPGSQ